MKKYHQQGAQLNESNHGIDFFYGENSKYHQIGKAYLEFDITLRENGMDFNILRGDDKVDEPIRLVNKAYEFRIATISTTGVEITEEKK